MLDTELVTRTAELIEAEVDGELVALNVASGTCYGFNGTATRVWALLDQPRSIAALRDILMSEFEVEASTCERQLVELLEDFQRDGLVRVEPGAPTA